MFFRYFSCAAIAAFSFAGTVRADTVAFDFVASPFTGPSAPYSSFSGRIGYTYDFVTKPTITNQLVDFINLTIGGYTYVASDVKFSTQVQQGVRYISFGMVGSGFSAMTGFKNNFNLVLEGDQFKTFSFASYATPSVGVQTTGFPSTGSVTYLPPAVPEPSSRALMLLGAAAAAVLTHRARRARSLLAQGA